MMVILTAGLLGLLGLAACGSEDGDDIAGVGERATAAMAGPDGSPMGTVTLEQGPNGVLVSADVSGLTPGAHGFHIHTVGTCTPDFSAAGGHYAPGEHGHGFMHADGLHAGDLPNIFAASDGTARADYFTAFVTLADDADTTVFDSDGSAIIIHAKPDTYASEAGAGDRVACGVIERS
jgi:Cu-Zn family superoxide dismutase